MSNPRDIEKQLERRVGAFLLLCLAGFIILASLAITGNNALRSKHEYYLVLDHGTGIAPGVPVTLSGIQVGAITDVALTDDRRVAMTLAVDQRYAGYIYADSIGRATTTLTGKTVFIEGGTKESGPLEDKGTLIGGQHFDVMLAIEQLDLVHTLQQVQEILSDINTVANQLNLGTGELPDAIDNLMGLLGDVREGKGAVGKLFTDDGLIVSLETTLTQVNDMAQAVDKAATSLDTTAGNIDNVAGSVVQSVDELVNIGKSFEKTSDHLAGTAESIEQTMSRLNGALTELSKTLQAIQNLPIVKGKVKKLDEMEAAE